MTAESRWKLVLDPDSVLEARETAWRVLWARARSPVLFQLRRRIEGWRLTEDFADELGERMYRHYQGRGLREDRARFRACVEDEVRRFLAEQGVDATLDPEFERDWASSLFSQALYTFKRLHPEWHRLLLRLFDRPEGQPPLDAARLAARLGEPEDVVARNLERGRAELKRMFAEEIAHTVSDPACVDEEVDRHMHKAETLLGA